MKIALCSTPFFGVPPPNYGGLERVVYDLWRGLIGRKHKVVCFSPDPTIVPEKGFHYSTGPAVDTLTNASWLDLERDMYQKMGACFEDFDLVHAHNWFGFEYVSKARNQNLKICHTHHGHVAYWLDTTRTRPWWGRPSPFKLNFMGISKHMKHMYDTGYNGQAPLIPSEYAYNGVDMDAYPYQESKGDRLMFLGRIDPIKRPDLARATAQRTGHPIDIIGGTSFVADKTYVENVKLSCDGVQNKFVGEVDHDTKIKYLQNAKALLIPSQFSEPFGLIAVEAMSCGTVPIALNDGALSEIIEHGKSGFICNSEDEMVNAVSKIDTISSADCRKRAEFFSKENCAKKYEELYKRILDGDSW